MGSDHNVRLTSMTREISHHGLLKHSSAFDFEMWFNPLWDLPPFGYSTAEDHGKEAGCSQAKMFSGFSSR
jgi:hypothetical protein